MISYDGTILTTFLGQDTVDVPEGETIYDYVQGELDSYGLTQLEASWALKTPTPSACPRPWRTRYGLETISDLIPIADQLTFGAEQEFFTLEGSMKYDPFVKFYGLNFQDGGLCGYGPESTPPLKTAASMWRWSTPPTA